MELLDELLTLERGFWEASGDPGYYRANMANDGLAVFSVGVMDKEGAITSTSDSGGWTDIQLSEPRLIQLTSDSVALVYEGSAQRDGKPYIANSSSVYVRRDNAWRLALHQQSAK